MEETTNDDVFDFAKEDPASEATESKSRSFIQGERDVCHFSDKKCICMSSCLRPKELMLASSDELKTQKRQQVRKYHNEWYYPGA